jgi:hypothetical protein
MARMANLCVGNETRFRNDLVCFTVRTMKPLKIQEIYCSTIVDIDGRNLFWVCISLCFWSVSWNTVVEGASFMKFVDLFSSSFSLSVYFLLRWLNIVSVTKIQGEDVNDFRYKDQKSVYNAVFLVSCYDRLRLWMLCGTCSWLCLAELRTSFFLLANKMDKSLNLDTRWASVFCDH